MALRLSMKEQKDNIFIVSVEGRLDTDTSISLKEKVKDVINPGIAALIIDMERLDYISSMGLGCVFSIKKEVESMNGKFGMINLQPQIRKVFDIVKAIPDSSIFSSIDKLDRYLDSIQRKEKNSDM